MYFNRKNRANVIKCGRKEQIATDFIRDHISGLSKNDLTSDPLTTTILCLARSPSSPVAMALANLHTVLSENGIAVRMIFSQIHHDQDGRTWTDIDTRLRFSREIRLITRPELHDAHETLVLDSMTSWIGDCLRREPTKNDAYEYYAANCAASASDALISFERLWKMCAPVLVHQPSANSTKYANETGGELFPGPDPSMLDEPSDDNGPMSATRH